jgi:hypothetical protein
MKRLQGILLLGILLAWAAPAPAQGLFAKKPKVIPSQRVPELILIVKTDTDDRKRQHAVEELRDYDATTFTEIVPVLVDVLLHDKKMNVRLEALTGLTRIRPVTTMAGNAIEKAAADDESWRVRLQAKTSLPKYHLAGYSSRKSDPVAAVKKKPTDEPPLAVSPPPPIPATVTSFPRPLPPGVATPPAPKDPPVQGPSLFPQ